MSRSCTHFTFKFTLTIHFHYLFICLPFVFTVPLIVGFPALRALRYDPQLVQFKWSFSLFNLKPSRPAKILPLPPDTVSEHLESRVEKSTVHGVPGSTHPPTSPHTLFFSISMYGAAVWLRGDRRGLAAPLHLAGRQPAANPLSC